MPTDLPPDYKPKPASDPGQSGDAKDPGTPQPGGADSLDGKKTVPQPGADAGVGRPGTDGDVVDPTGLPGSDPAPAGMPTF